MSKFMLNLSVKPKNIKNGQTQLAVSHEQAVSLLKAAGAPEKVFLSRKRFLTLTILTPNTQQKLTIRQRDTHSIWVQHQEGDSHKLLEWAWNQCAKTNGTLAFEVVGVTYTDLEDGGEASQVNLEECPF